MTWGLSRLGKGLSGLVDFVEAPVQLTWDLSKAAHSEGFSDGFFAKAYEAVNDRAGQAMGGIVGRNGALGQLFGAIPEPVRSGTKKVIGNGTSEDRPGFGLREAFGGGITGLLEGVGREFIREPLSTAMTVASLGESDTWKGEGHAGGFGAFFDKKAWSKGHQIAQSRSLGQAIAAAVMTKDILDEDELIKAQQTKTFTMVSGGFDFAARIYLEPDVVLSKGRKLATKSGRAAILAEETAKEIRAIGRLEKARERATTGSRALITLEGNQKKLGKVLRVVQPEADAASTGSAFDATRARAKLAGIDRVDDFDQTMGWGGGALERMTANNPGTEVRRGVFEMVDEGGDTHFYTRDAEGNITSFLTLRREGDQEVVKGLAKAPGTAKGAAQKLYAAAESRGWNVAEAGADSMTDAGRASRAKFITAKENAATFAEPAVPQANPNMHAAVEQMLNKSKADALGDAIDLAGRGDTGGLHKWAQENGLKFTYDQVDKATQDPRDAWELFTKQIAEKKGFNRIQITDKAGTLVDDLDLGNYDDTIDKAINKTLRNRRLRGKAGVAEGDLTKLDRAGATLEMWRRGGWESALDYHKGNVAELSAALKDARTATLQSRNWTKAKTWMAGLEDLPLGQRIEQIRDRLLHQASDGDNVATWFALARDDASRDALMRLHMGDFASISDLHAYDPAMAREVMQVAGKRALIRNYPSEGLFNDVNEEFRLFNDPGAWTVNGSVGKMLDSFKVAPDEVLQDVDYYVRGAQRAENLDGRAFTLTRQQYKDRQARRAAEGIRPTNYGDDTLETVDDAISQSPAFDEGARMLGDPIEPPAGAPALADTPLDTLHTGDRVGLDFYSKNPYGWEQINEYLDSLVGKVRNRHAENVDKARLSGMEPSEHALKFAEHFTEDDLKAVRGFVNEFGPKYLDNVNFSFIKGNNPYYPNAAGLYHWGSKNIEIATQALEDGRVTHTIMHEIMHHVSTYAAAEDLDGLFDHFIDMRQQYIKRYGKGVLESLGMDPHARDWGELVWDINDVHRAHLESGIPWENYEKVLVVDPKHDNLVRFKHDRASYRFTTFDEFFAEEMSDIALKRHAVNDKQLKILKVAGDILGKLMTMLKRVKGADYNPAEDLYNAMAEGRRVQGGGITDRNTWSRSHSLTIDYFGQRYRYKDGTDFADVALDMADDAEGVATKLPKPPTSLEDDTLDHADHVRAALERGDDVPRYVLKDYPMLAAEYGKTIGNDVSDADLEIQRLMMIAGEHSDFMKMTARGAIRSGVFGKVWQNEHNTLRVFFNMVAHPFLDPDDPMYVANLKRHLRDARFAPERQQELLGEMAAVRWNPENRLSVLERIQTEAIHNLAQKHGIDMDVANEIVAKVRDAVGLATEHVRLYAGNTTEILEDGTRSRRNFSWVPIRDADSFDHMAVPLTPEQLSQADLMPNFREIDKAMKRIGDWKKYGYLTLDHLGKLPAHAADAINRAWKPAVLLRPAWPIRVVFDEQIRMMSAMGVMGVLGQYRDTGRELKYNLMRDMFPKVDHDKNVLWMSVNPETGELLAPSKDNMGLRAAQKVVDRTKARNRLGVAGAVVGGAIAGPQGAAIGGLLGARSGLRNADFANGMAALNMSRTTRNVAFDGYSFLSAMGHPGAVANIYREKISANKDLAKLRDQNPSEVIHSIKFDPKRFVTYNPGDPGYEAVWSTAINHQFSNSTFSKMLWDDTLSDQDLVDWLHTAEGRKTLRVMPKERREDPDHWVAEARAFLNTNVLPPTEDTMGLRARLAQGDKVNFNEVKQALGPNWDRVLGDIHGMALMQVTDARNPLIKGFQKRLDNAMNHLAKTPTDTLSREPFFRFQYQQQIEKQVTRIKASMNGDTYRMSERELRNLEDQARRIALSKTKTLLYDLAEESQFSQAVRFLMPFYSAWQEVLTRYAGIAVENPGFVGNMYRAYRGIDEIGDTYTDENGNSVQRFRLPEWAKGLINAGMFKSAIDDQGYVAFNKSGLNMLAQGTPSFGPIVTFTASRALQERPELTESLKFMFPYGPSTGIVEAFAPTWAKRTISAETEDRTFKSTMGRIAADAIVTANLRGEPIDLNDPETADAFYKKVTDQAKAFYQLRTVAALGLPLAPQWQSPYQDYIDEWRKMAREDPENAEANFLSKYGEDYFALTQSLSKVFDGVPATIEGETKRKEYKTLIEAYPEFGGLIIGSEGGGKGVQFSRAIYDKQFRESISEGNPQKRRENFGIQDVATQPEVRLGWEKWRRFADWKTDQMQRMGLTSLNQKGAEPIAAMQKLMIAQIAAKHPKWYEDFVDDDPAKWLRKAKAMDAIANTTNPQLAARQDIAGLRRWVNLRKQVESELQRREKAGGSAYLTSKSNTDLRLVYEGAQQKIIEENPMFAELAARWLNNDRVEPDSWLING